MKPSGFFLCLFSAVALFSCAKEPPALPETAPVKVTVEKVEAVEVPDYVTAVGTVESKKEAVLSSKVMGVIQEFWVREGDRVGKGSVLLTIEDAAVKARNREAVESRAEGAAGLREAEAARAEAAAGLENAEANLTRFQNLYREHAVTKKELDDALTLSRTFKAKVEQAEARTAQMRAKIAQADAVISQTDIQIAETLIRAPMSGVVTAKTANAGETAVPGRPLLKVVDDSQLRLSVSVEESEMAGLIRGEPMKVSIDALFGRELEGTISEIVPAADPSTRSFTVKVNLPNTEGLMSGMFGRAYLRGGTRKAVFLPPDSLVDREGAQVVFVVTPTDTLRVQTVRLGRELNGRKEAVAGLSGGEVVVTGGVSGLREGQKVLR